LTPAPKEAIRERIRETWFATKNQRNALTVENLLRHERIENTTKYVCMIHFKDDEFEVTTATTEEEAKQVLSTSFDYVTQKDDIMLFRKPRDFAEKQYRLRHKSDDDKL
jgi:hypothetical protein